MENQYQFTLSARGGLVTEVGAIQWADTQVPGPAGGATIQMNSSEIPVFPIEFNTNAYGAIEIAVTPANDGSDGVTRRPVSAYGERVVRIDSHMILSAARQQITDNFITMVEFVRTGE